MIAAIPRRRIGVLTLTAVILSLVGPLADNDAHAITEQGLELKRKINRARVGHGKRRLRVSDRLSKVAQRHTQEMASQNKLHHNSNLSSELSSFSWSVLGENVGVGATIASLHRAFMNSPPHRKNVLRRSFRKVGVGTVQAGGRLWVTVVFSG